MESYRLDLERRFLPCLVSRGVKDAREITEADIATLLGAERVRGVSAWSLRKSYDIVKRFLEWCVTQGEIQHNPATF